MHKHSRYANRYNELQQSEEPRNIPQPGTLGRTSAFQNIASGNFQSVSISCWPLSECLEGGRRWGKLDSNNVAIMPFTTRADPTNPVVRLDSFEIELHICEIGPQGARPDSYPWSCPQEQLECQPHSPLWLVVNPAPTVFPVGQAANAAADKSWTFRSKEIQYCDGKTRGGKWIWEANGHEPVLLYGGMALQHQCDPFLVACQVSGRASIERSKGAYVRLIFTNENIEPRWWEVQPLREDTDLKGDVRRLQSEMRSLNSEESGIQVHGPIESGTQGYGYGLGHVSGYGTAIQGNVYLTQPCDLNLRPRIFEADPRLKTRGTSTQPGSDNETRNQRTRLPEA